MDNNYCHIKLTNNYVNCLLVFIMNLAGSLIMLMTTCADCCRIAKLRSSNLNNTIIAALRADLLYLGLPFVQVSPDLFWFKEGRFHLHPNLKNFLVFSWSVKNLISHNAKISIRVSGDVFGFKTSNSRESALFFLVSEFLKWQPWFVK